MQAYRNSVAILAAALTGALLSAGCAGGGGLTAGPTLAPSSSPGNISGSQTTVIGGGSTQVGSGGGDTDLNLPGGGGGGGTAVQGSGYSPAIAIPASESFQDYSSRSDDDVTAYVKNLVETLPDPGASNSSVYQNESLQNWAYAIFEGANRARRAEGLAPLEYERHLEVLAQAHARDMGLRNYFGHDTPDGVLMWDRWMAMRIPYCNWAGENTAMGQETAQEVIDQWLTSPGHRKNMMHPDAQYVGVGVYFDADDASMPIKVVMELANFRDDPSSHDWYELGDVYR
jgi:uncharacterized protein YkwD